MFWASCACGGLGWVEEFPTDLCDCCSDHRLMWLGEAGRQQASQLHLSVLITLNLSCSTATGASRANCAKPKHPKLFFSFNQLVVFKNTLSVTWIQHVQNIRSGWEFWSSWTGPTSKWSSTGHVCGFLAGSGAAPQALLVVLEFVACFSGTQETPWRLCRPCSPVHPHHGSLACWLGHLATLGFVFIQHIFWHFTVACVCVCACGRFHVALIYLQVSDKFCVFFFFWSFLKFN